MVGSSHPNDSADPFLRIALVPPLGVAVGTGHTMSATLALSLLSEVKAALQETLAETVDARPSRRQRAAAHHEDKKVSCTACRFRKIQCFGEVGFPCVRCTEKNLDCTFPPRARPGPKVTNA